MLMYSFIKRKGRVMVGEVVDYIKLAQPTVSYHLKEMKDAGLLSSEKVGKEVYYELADECPVHKRVCAISKVTF